MSQNWVMAVWGLVELTILVSDEDGIAIIKYAFSKGITFFDTLDIYGVDHSNEMLVGKLATKFGIVKMEPTQVVVKGTVEYVRSCCEASLKGLGVDYIDLYYVHRIDTLVPIEEIMGELKKLMEDSKIKYIGLPKASPNTIRRAHAAHPITALQMKYYLLTRDIEEEIIPLCRCLILLPKFCKNLHLEGTWNCDSSIFPYCSWFFVGKAVVESVPTDSFLWTTKIKNLDENIGALRVKLTEDDLKEISNAVPILKIAGPRIYKSFTRVSLL
ncbi:unnamed protein product [Camellia sinensis]